MLHSFVQYNASPRTDQGSKRAWALSPWERHAPPPRTAPLGRSPLVDRDFFHLCLCSSASSPLAIAVTAPSRCVTCAAANSSVSAVVSGRRRPGRISDSRGSVRTNAGSLQLAPSVANVRPMTAPRRNAARMHPFPTGKPKLPQLSRRIGGGPQRAAGGGLFLYRLVDF